MNQPGTRRLPAAQRRQQLLDTALDLFGHSGFHETSMEDIAEAAGVTKPILYQHFGSKRELILELLADLGSRLDAQIRNATTSADTPRAQVEEGFRAYFEWVDANPRGFEVLFSSETRRDTDFTTAAIRVEDGIAGTIARLIAVDTMTDDERRLMAYAIVGIAEATCRHWLAGDVAVDSDRLAEAVARLAWAGLRGLPGDR